MACCGKTPCKTCKDLSKLASLATSLHATYTAKQAERQGVK
jgi:hypothetical protein